jgi:putative transposase
MAILRWCQETCIDWHYIEPGPFDRLRVRADPDRLRRKLQRPLARRPPDQVRGETLFASLAHAREALAIWKDDYNTVRPHSGIGNLPPAAYAKLGAPAMQRDGALRSTGGSGPHPVAPPGQAGSIDGRTLPAAG